MPFPLPPGSRWPFILSVLAIAASATTLVLALSGPDGIVTTSRSVPAGLAYDEDLGVLVLNAKSEKQLFHRYAGLVVRQPEGEETAGIFLDMSGRSERFNDGIFIYTDSERLDHTSGIQIQNEGAADGIHVNLGCRSCSPEVNARTNTGIGIDQWSNGTGFFTFVHGGGRGVDAVLYPSASNAWAGSFRAASDVAGSGDLVHVDNGGNPNVRSLNVVRGTTDLRETTLHGNLHMEREVGEDTVAIRFAQSDHNAPSIDANLGWLRVIDESSGDAERFLVEASTGNVRFTGHVGRGADDGVVTTDAAGVGLVEFVAPYDSVPLVSCTPVGAYACFIESVTVTGSRLRVGSLEGGAPTAGVTLHVLVRGT